MILATRAVLFFALIWALTSFGFTAGMLTTLLGQSSYISEEQLRGVAAASGIAAVVALGLASLIALHLLGKSALVMRIPARALLMVGLAFSGMAVYSFLIVPTGQHGDFFQRFASGARFEFLVVGVAALTMGTRKA